jgi:hypothetical protein
VFEFLVAHLVIPLLAGLVVLAIVVISSKDKPDWDAANDGALDLTILSIGATGALFLNQKFQEHWHQITPLLGIAVVLANLLLTCVLAYRRRWKPEGQKALDFRNVWPDIFFGVLALIITTAVFVFGAGVLK